MDSEQREYLLCGESIMLVKLTEVCDSGAVTTRQLYSLREVFINPEHVVMVREEKRMRELNESGKVAPGQDVFVKRSFH